MFWCILQLVVVNSVVDFRYQSGMCLMDWVPGENYNATAQEIQLVRKSKRKWPSRGSKLRAQGRTHGRTDICDPMKMLGYV